MNVKVRAKAVSRTGKKRQCYVKFVFTRVGLALLLAGVWLWWNKKHFGWDISQSSFGGADEQGIQLWSWSEVSLLAAASSLSRSSLWPEVNSDID